MPSKRRAQQLPSIFIEDFESKEVKLEFSSFPVIPDLCTPDSKEYTTVFQPHVDAYVTPLSLCHASTPIASFPDKLQMMSTGRAPNYPDYETSFTSVDIGGPNTSKPSSSNCTITSMNSGHSTAGCFDIRSGILRITQSVATGLGTGFEEAPGRDLHLDVPTTPSKPPTRKRFDIRYAVGIFFLCLAFAAIVAICVTIYVEFVAKPSWSASEVHSVGNVSSICDYILNGCEYNNTSVMSHLVNHTVAFKDSGRTEGKLSENFLSKIPAPK